MVEERIADDFNFFALLLLLLVQEEDDDDFADRFLGGIMVYICVMYVCVCSE